MYLNTVPGDPSIYILPNRSREHAIPLHGVESLGLGPPPAKHQQQHIRGNKRTQAPDGGKKAHQHALAHITVHPAAHLPKDFGTERHIVLEGQAHHIITAALYTLAAHERHWDATTIPAMPPPPQGPKDPVTPFHIDQLLSRRATRNLHPSRIELAIPSWDTLDTPPKRPAIQFLKADAQWWVLHWAHGVLMAAQAYTPEIDPEDPPRGRHRLLQATILTGREGAPWEALHTALYWAQGSPNGPDTPEPTEAWVMQAKAMRNYHLHHPSNDSPAALPWPSYPWETVRNGWQLNVINAHVPFGDATEPFLQALAEAYRQMAMLAPTVIIGDMNAAPTPADRGGQAAPQDQAVRNTIEMLGLVDLTVNLEGQPSHFPHQTDPAPSRIDVCYGDPTTLIRAEARYSPLHIRLTIPKLPPSPLEDADQGLPPPLKMPRLHEKHAWSQYHRAIDRARRIQPDLTNPGPWRCVLFVLLASRSSALRALSPLLWFPPGLLLLPGGCCPPPPPRFVSHGFCRCCSVLCFFFCSSALLIACPPPP